MKQWTKYVKHWSDPFGEWIHQNQWDRVRDHLIKHQGSLWLRFQLRESSPTSLLNEALKSHQEEIVHLLIQERVHLNHRDDQGCTPLITALKEGWDEMAEKLIQAGVDLNAVSHHEETALLTAWKRRAPSWVSLLKAGVDVNGRVGHGNTLLIHAVRSGDVETVKTLIHYGADVNVMNHWKQTALMLAAWLSWEDLTEMLVKVPGVDINRVNEKGDSALLLAAENSSLRVIQLLVEHGANVMQRNHQGLDAETIAWQAQCHQVSRYLKAFKDQLHLKRSVDPLPTEAINGLKSQPSTTPRVKRL